MGTWGNVRTPSITHGKPRGGLPIRSLSLTVGDVMCGNLSKSAFFEGGWVTLSANFRRKGASSTNHCWRQKTTVIALSCGIKISALPCLVLLQRTRMTNRRTDKRTKLGLPRPR